MPRSNTTTAVQELSDDRPEGTRLGRDSASLIAFWGGTPADQPANVASVATSTVTTAATTTTPWGFATSTQADAVTAQVVLLRTGLNSIITNLEAMGVQADS